MSFLAVEIEETFYLTGANRQIWPTLWAPSPRVLGPSSVSPELDQISKWMLESAHTGARRVAYLRPGRSGRRSASCIQSAPSPPHSYSSADWNCQKSRPTYATWGRVHSGVAGPTPVLEFVIRSHSGQTDVGS